MKKERRHFDKEFKLMAVNLCLSGKTAGSVASELGISSEMLRRWRREYEQFQSGCFSGNGRANMTEDQREIARLKKELRNAEIERDILKKAVSIFSRSDGKYFNS